MLNQDFSGPSKWPQLTLKRAARHHQLTRLLPCGNVEQKRSGTACAVFVKRTRASSKLLPLLPPKQKFKTANPERGRGRKGSFLRLARMPQQSQGARA
jgi:hypothetical protein